MIKLTKQLFEKLFPIFNAAYVCIFLAALMYNFQVIQSEALFKMILGGAFASILPFAYLNAYIWSILPDENQEQIAAEYAEYQNLIKQLTRGQ